MEENGDKLAPIGVRLCLNALGLVVLQYKKDQSNDKTQQNRLYQSPLACGNGG